MSTALAGKRALITGSTQGLGLAAAQRLAASGCHVVINGFGEPGEVSALLQDLKGRGEVQAIYSPADLKDPRQIENMVAQAVATLGGVDIVVNNAVVRHVASVETLASADWDEGLAVNLSAAFHTIRLTLPGMKTRNWGRIVNVSSIYGLIGATNRIGYVTTKTALLGLTRAVALETTGYNITCNAICPGTSTTPVHEASVQALMDARQLARADAERLLLVGKQPTGRLISSSGAAALIAFLCGPDARDITGASMPIDGGWSVR